MKHPVVTCGTAGGVISISTGTVLFFIVGLAIGVIIALLLKK